MRPILPKPGIGKAESERYFSMSFTCVVCPKNMAKLEGLWRVRQNEDLEQIDSKQRLNKTLYYRRFRSDLSHSFAIVRHFSRECGKAWAVESSTESESLTLTGS